MTGQPTIQRIDFLGVPIDTGVSAGDVCELLRYKNGLRMVTFVNPSAWAIMRQHPNYVPILRQLSLVLPDGESVALACRLLTRLHCRRLSFDNTSVAAPFFAACAAEQASLILVGGK